MYGWIALLSQYGRIPWVDREEFSLEEPSLLIFDEIVSNDVSDFVGNGRSADYRY